MLSSAAQGNVANDTGAATLLAAVVSACASGLTILIGIFVPWMDGALTYSVIERVLGHQTTWREAYSATRPRWGSLWVANAIRTIVMVLALVPLIAGLSLFAGVIGAGALAISRAGVDSGLLMVGLLAICLPIGLVGAGLAIFVAASWSMTVPAIVGEGVDGVPSLGRSNDIVKGDRWRIIGRLLIFEVMRFFVITLPLYALQIFVLGGSLAAFGSGDTSPLGLALLIASTIFGSIVDVLVVPLYAIYITLNYFDLRVRKENLDLQLKAAQMAPVAAPELPTAVAPQATANAQGTQDVISPATQQSQPPVFSPANSGPVARPVIDSSLPPGQRISLMFKRLRTEGQNAELLNELGLAYQELGDLNGALDAFTRAHDLAPSDADIVYNLAILQRDRRDMPGARRAMAEYLQLETNPDERQKVLDNPSLKNLIT
jgi:hypothetical protein